MAVTKQLSNSEETISLTDTIKITSNGTGYSSMDYGAIPPFTTTTSGTAYTYSTPSVTIGQGLSANAVWTTDSTSYNWSAVGTTMKPSGKITLQGNDADIDINGKSMKAWMEQVEERLNILTPNTELEAEWDELRELGERYRELEKLCKEKSEAWNKLKKL